MQCSLSKRGKKCPICEPVKTAIRREKLSDGIEILTKDFESVNMGMDVKDDFFVFLEPPPMVMEEEEEATSVLIE